MKFGAVPDDQLSQIDLRLPPLPDSNFSVLPRIRSAHPKVYVGSAHWGHSSWSGRLYPAKTPASRYRQLYPQHFSALELNATHYTIYPPETLEQWSAPARGRNFVFCPKFPQQISHHSQFRQTESLTAAFLQSVAALGENLGPLFLQTSEYFAPSDKEALFAYLRSLPKAFSYFVEVRHPAWFSVPAEREAFFSFLNRENMGAVITDTPGRRDIVHMQLTVPKLFLRFVCNGLHPTSYRRTDEWIHVLQQWIDAGLDEAYILLHPGAEETIPDLAAYWINGLNKSCRLELPLPQPIQPQLF